MTALPPLPDHRPAVLQALASLGATGADKAVDLATIRFRAALDAGQAWATIYQLTRTALVASVMTVSPQFNLYWLTPEGLALIPHLDDAASGGGQ